MSKHPLATAAAHALALASMWAVIPVHAQTCEILQAQIDTKIRAGGGANYTLVTVDVGAPDVGRVVGSCGMGSKKILYSAVGGPRGVGPGATLLNPGGARPRTAPMQTECRDGYAGADCSVRIARPASVAAPVGKASAP